MAGKNKQRGITLLGFVGIMLLAAVVAMILMNLVPVYSEANSVRSALKKLSDEPGIGTKELPEIQRALQKRFDIDYVESVKAEQLTVVRDKGATNLVLNYEVRKTLVYNLDFVAKFDNSVPVGGGAPSGP